MRKREIEKKSEKNWERVRKQGMTFERWTQTNTDKIKTHSSVFYYCANFYTSLFTRSNGILTVLTLYV